MLRLRIGKHSSEVALHGFMDDDSGDFYKPDEYKSVKNAIKEGHYIFAQYSEGDNNKIYVSSQIIWVNENRFKTAYRMYKYHPF